MPPWTDSCQIMVCGGFSSCSTEIWRKKNHENAEKNIFDDVTLWCSIYIYIPSKNSGVKINVTRKGSIGVRLNFGSTKYDPELGPSASSLQKAYWILGHICPKFGLTMMDPFSWSRWHGALQLAASVLIERRPCAFFRQTHALCSFLRAVKIKQELITHDSCKMR